MRYYKNENKIVNSVVHNVNWLVVREIAKLFEENKSDKFILFVIVLRHIRVLYRADFCTRGANFLSHHHQ